MKRFRKLMLKSRFFVAISLIILGIGTSQDFQYTNTSDFAGDPSYTIGIQTSNSQVSPGEPYKLSFFLTGAGNVDFGKLSVSIPRYLAKGEMINYTTIDYRIDKSGSPSAFRSIHVTSPSFTSRLPNLKFIPRNYSTFDNYGELKYKDSKGKQYFPHEIEFTVSKNTPGGDHYIYLNLFYKYKDKWYNDRQVVTLHINRWYENEFLQFLVYCVAILEILQILGASKLFRWRKKEKE